MIHRIFAAIDKPYISPLNYQAHAAYRHGIVRGLVLGLCALLFGIVVGELLGVM